MTAADTRIKDLVKLTKGRSKTDRTLLYRHIAHLIIQRRNSYEDPKKGQDDTKILFELFDALSRQVDAEIRIELAKDLSRRENPPEELTKRLALDKINIAEHVLKSTPFKEQTLLNIINSTGKAHHLIITERKDLSQKLWQAIVDNRDGDKEGTTKQKAKKEKEEKPVKTPLIQFPRRAVDLFVPSNDKTPAMATPVVAASNKEMPPIPSFFLGKPPAKAKAENAPAIKKTNTSPLAGPDPVAGPDPLVGADVGAEAETAICWSVNRRGEIEKLDDGAEKYLGESPDQLIGQNLWHMLDMTVTSDIYNAIIKRHPIRNLVVKLLESGEKLRIIGHAQFEPTTGKFTGFDGTLRPVEDNLNTTTTRTSRLVEGKQVHVPQQPPQPQQQTPISDTDTASGHILAAHLSADASTPIQDMLEGIQRIARAARRNNDTAMLTDIRSVMADCFKLRDMVEDTDRIARMFGGGECLGDENFDVFKVLNSCLDDDTTRHGNIVHFQLLPQTTNPMVHFSRNILRQAFARMLEMARESNLSAQLIPIYIHPVEDGRLEVTIPLGALTGDKSIDNRDLDTDDRLKLGVVHRKRSGDPVMTASLGLTTLSGSIDRLGGSLNIIQSYNNPDASDTSERVNTAGSVSIRLPVS